MLIAPGFGYKNNALSCAFDLYLLIILGKPTSDCSVSPVGKTGDIGGFPAEARGVSTDSRNEDCLAVESMVLTPTGISGECCS